MSKDVKQFLQEEMEKEKERLLAEVEQDDTLQDIEVPDEIEERLFAQIHSYEEGRREREKEESGTECAPEASEWTAEEAELIRLGRVYKRRRRLSKYIVLAAALVLALALGMTSLGGPEKVIRMITEAVNGGGTETEFDVDDGSVHVVESENESDAFREIESQWNINPVRMNYLPEGIVFKKAEKDDFLQTAYLFYQKNGEIKIYYQVRIGYLSGSLVTESEENNLKSYTNVVGDVPVTVTKYPVEENETTRWCIQFKWENAQYLIWILDEKLEEVNKIVENLIFL